jgi:hypothetical protein
VLLQWYLIVVFICFSLIAKCLHESYRYTSPYRCFQIINLMFRFIIYSELIFVYDMMCRSFFSSGARAQTQGFVHARQVSTTKLNPSPVCMCVCLYCGILDKIDN